MANGGGNREFMILNVRCRTTLRDHLSLTHTIEERSFEESSKCKVIWN